MHVEAQEGFAAALLASGLDSEGEWRVLDIGGQDVNGTVHDYFPHSKITVLDLYDGPGVDIVADACTWEPTSLFDVVISTEVLEHVADWRSILATSAKALDPDGPATLLLTCASTGRPEHGQHGAPGLEPGEYYGNVDPQPLRVELTKHYTISHVTFQHIPGDAYVWAIR